HLILERECALFAHRKILVELQIRTMLQHQWSVLSHSEFYKSLAEIPPALLERMRVLGEILHCADIESDHLRRSRIQDEASVSLRRLLREEVLDRLSPRAVADGVAVSHVGESANRLLEMEVLVRRALVGDEDSQGRAVMALEALTESLRTEDECLEKDLRRIVARVKAVVDGVPQQWT
ncbi:MAG: hypothetical protein JOZ15_20640, partial [Acidobacteria bacterium]|nr:hypothetical protein [Acidobacteriota bacterium]